MMIRLVLLLTSVAIANFSSGLAYCDAPERTNVILIVSDNQGAWTLGCYGNQDIATPHLDRLAEEGMRFTQAFSPNGVCSPTRASLLTGLIPSQHGVHSYLGANEAQIGPDAYCTIREFKTLPKVLDEAGYECGMIGKWHLGGNESPQEGFKTWVTMPHGHTTTFYDAAVIENGDIRKEPSYLTDFWTKRAVDFIEKNEKRPFFLYLAYNGPYGLGPSLKHDSRNRHAERYATEFLPSFPRDGIHPWLHGNKSFIGNETAIRRVAAETSGVDDGVGEVIATVDRLGLREKTLVIYTADQGWLGGQNGFWGMADHTRPLTAYDGMMHIPLIMRQPGKIAEGATSDLLVSGYDLMPTILSKVGIEASQATNAESPGRDFSAALRSEKAEWENVVYFEMETTRAIRTAEWKYIHRPIGPYELYNLENDPSERVNLFGQPGYAETVADLKKRLDEFFEKYADKKYDLYHGGGSKTHLLSQRKSQ